VVDQRGGEAGDLGPFGVGGRPLVELLERVVQAA
jgi:hypothetical protein